jgi:hypothetical protein
VNKNYPNKKPFAKILKYLKSIDKSGEEYQSDKLAKIIFKDKSKNKELGTILSALDEKCREWLVLDDFQKGSIEAKVLLLDIVNRKGLSEKIYYKRNKRMQQLIEKSNKKDSGGEYNRWKTKNDAVFHSSFNHVQQKEKELIMLQAEEDLDNFYILTKLRYAYEKVVTLRLKESIIPKESKTDANNLSLRYMNSTHPLICFFALVIQLELTENISYYESAKSLLSKYACLINPIQLPNYFACLHNYIASSLRKKKVTARYLFDLQKLAVEKDWVTGGGQMPVTTFNNIVTTACIVKETLWAKDFIKKFSSKLPNDEKNTTITLAKARVLFNEKKFKEAAQMLIEYKIDYAALRVKSLLMCCLYESNKNDIYFLKSKFKNYQIQVKNMKSINENIKKACLNFIEILLKFTNGNVDYKKLQTKVEQSESLVFQDWLIEKVNERI